MNQLYISNYIQRVPGVGTEIFLFLLCSPATKEQGGHIFSVGRSLLLLSISMPSLRPNTSLPFPLKMLHLNYPKEAQACCEVYF